MNFSLFKSHINKLKTNLVKARNMIISWIKNDQDTILTLRKCIWGDKSTLIGDERLVLKFRCRQIRCSSKSQEVGLPQAVPVTFSKYLVPTLLGTASTPHAANAVVNNNPVNEEVTANNGKHEILCLSLSLAKNDQNM